MEPDGRKMIHEACRQMERFLLGKNDKYNNSIFDPVRILTPKDASPELLVKARIDDKISRLVHGNDHEDAVLDLAGYLICLLAIRGFGRGEHDEGGR